MTTQGSSSRLQQIQSNLEQSRSRLQQIKEKLNNPPESTSSPFASTSASILNYASALSDLEWQDLILKSIDYPIIDGIEMPGFPSEEVQLGSVGSVARLNLPQAFSFYSEIKRYLAEFGQPITPDSRLLDFGCGWGRIIRFFLKDIFTENLYGIDVWPKMIDICRNTIRYGNYTVCNTFPPLDLADQSIDIIYSYSVFSHLSEPVHIKWVEEFARILKPGGIFIATTQSRNFIEFCRSLRGKEHDFPWHMALANSFLDTEAAFADYDTGKFLYSATGGGAELLPANYGEAIISPSYVKEQWTKYLEFCDFVDDPGRCPQAIIVMQKQK